MNHKKISILGCGWLGNQLVEALHAKGFYIKASVATDTNKIARRTIAENYRIVLPDISEEEHSFFDTDYLIIAIPPGGGELPYAQKLSGLRSAPLMNIRGVIFISSTTVYREGDITHSFHSFSLANNPRAVEILDAEAKLSVIFGEKLTVLRCGGLIGEGRNPARFFAGRSNVPKGMAPVNLISSSDVFLAVESIISRNKWGKKYPFAHPNHLSKQEFYTESAVRAGLSAPQFSDLQKDKQIDATYTWQDLQIEPIHPNLLDY